MNWVVNNPDWPSGEGEHMVWADETEEAMNGDKLAELERETREGIQTRQTEIKALEALLAGIERSRAVLSPDKPKARKQRRRRPRTTAEREASPHRVKSATVERVLEAIVAAGDSVSIDYVAQTLGLSPARVALAVDKLTERGDVTLMQGGTDVLANPASSNGTTEPAQGATPSHPAHED